MSNKNLIQASTPFERVLHWILAISFLILAVTGLGFMFHSLSFVSRFFGGLNAMQCVHNYVGIIFGISVLFSLFTWIDAAKFDSDDIQWFKVGGGYLKKDVEVPEMGRYNAGQKLFFVFVIIFGGLLFISGIIMWFPLSFSKGLVKLSYVLHVLSFLALGLFTVVHIYLGSVGVPGGLQAITRGYVEKAWAKKHHPKWLREVESQE
jgi:formate dehydrogenase subunit gamma